MSAAALNTHLFWITSRAAGSLALILASLSVGLGLLMAGKLLKGRTPDLRVLHEALALGTIGGWAIVVLGLSFYVRDRIGRNRWKLLHRFTALGWLLGADHALGEGTDAGQWWFLASM